MSTPCWFAVTRSTPAAGGTHRSRDDGPAATQRGSGASCRDVRDRSAPEVFGVGWLSDRWGLRHSLSHADRTHSSSPGRPSARLAHPDPGPRPGLEPRRRGTAPATPGCSCRWHRRWPRSSAHRRHLSSASWPPSSPGSPPPVRPTAPRPICGGSMSRGPTRSTSRRVTGCAASPCRGCGPTTLEIWTTCAPSVAGVSRPRTRCACCSTSARSLPTACSRRWSTSWSRVWSPPGLCAAPWSVTPARAATGSPRSEPPSTPGPSRACCPTASSNGG